jgi:vitamin B12 transporter
VYLNNIASVFNLEAGGRYNHQSNYGSNWTYAVTPSVNVLPDNQLKLFGTVSTSFKVPDLSALFGRYGANPNLKPEKSQDYEAGFSTQLFGNVFNLRADVYKRRITNAIVYLTPQGYFNQDRQIVKGIEIEPSVNVGIFNLKGYYTYLRANAITLNAGMAALQTNFLYRRPAHTIGLLAGAQATNKLYFNVNYHHYSNRKDLFFDNNTFTSSVQSLKGYNLVDAYAEYKIISNKLKAFVDVKNILNEKYAELYGYTALGTNFNAGLSFNFHR